MNEFNKAKQEYDQIPIPDELSKRITLEIEHAGRKRNMKRKTTTHLTLRNRSMAAAAAVIAAFTLGLNTSPAFAKEMQNVPILGEVAKVLTFRTYEVNTEDYIITVEIPSIEMISEDFTDLEDSINADIYRLCEQYAQESKENALEYRKAFLETGGTLEEWLEHDIKINVSYSVQLQTDEYLSLAVKRTENWNSASAETKLYNINLKTGEQVTMDEVLAATNTTYYEDNYAVDTETAAAHAKAIQAAILNHDLEKLAEYTAYPVYVGFADEGLVIEEKDDFIALGADRIFADDFVASVGNADVSDLVPSKAGFVISGEDLSANIIFGVIDGQLKISGINY